MKGIFFHANSNGKYSKGEEETITDKIFLIGNIFRIDEEKIRNSKFKNIKSKNSENQ